MAGRSHFNLKFLTLLLLILFMHFNQPVHAQSMDQQGENSAHSYQHRRLGKRERREVQKEFLSFLGLSHRPRPDGEPARGLQEESAPLYMLGLYNTVSGFSELFHTRIQEETPPRNSESNSFLRQNHLSPPSSTETDRIPHRTFTHSVGSFSDDLPTDVHIATNSAYYKLREAHRVFSNEVGIPENNGKSIYFEGGTLEKRLLGDADVVMSFISKSPKGKDDVDEVTRSHLRRHRPFFFKLDQIPNEDVLKGARFRLYKNISGGSIDNRTLRVNVYQVKRNSINGHISLMLLGSLRVESRQEGWLSFDVYVAVNDWLRNASDNMGLRVSVETLEGRSVNLNKAGIVGSKRGDSSKRAFLVAFLMQGSKKLPRRLRRRMKRSTTENDPEEQRETGVDENEQQHRRSAAAARSPKSSTTHEKRISKRAGKERRRKSKPRNKNRNRLKYDRGGNDVCHREELYVNFQDLNWDEWIIAPAGYRAFHCMGACKFPLNANMNATNHAIVQTLVHLMTPDRLRQPCCSPTKLEPISVLYYDDDNNVVYKKYTDMVVNACGCL